MWTFTNPHTMKRVILFAGALLLSVPLIGCAHNISLNRGVYSVSDTVAVKRATRTAQGLGAANFRMRDGSATIIGTDGDSIRATVVLGPHPDRDLRGACSSAAASAASVSLERVANTVEIRLDAGRSLRCAEHWTIELPKGLTFTGSGEVSHLRLSRMNADTYASTDVGDVSITSGGGSATARVRSVGNAVVESTSSSYEEAVVEADVGRTELLIDGHKVDVRQAPGPGGRISLRGSGRDKLRAETGVGNAKLSIGKSPG
jgi:hypothetical protein